MEKETTDSKLGHALCQFSKGEERGAHLLWQLLDFAPDDDVREQVAQQAVDEERHHHVFSTRLTHLELDCAGLKKHLNSLYDLAQECVDRKDWAECMAIQTAIEELAMASFGHAIKAMPLDEETRQTILDVIADERRHLEFGMGQLKRLVQDEENAAKIQGIQRQVIALMTAAAKEDIPAQERIARLMVMKQAYRTHQARCRTIGLPVPQL